MKLAPIALVSAALGAWAVLGLIAWRVGDPFMFAVLVTLVAIWAALVDVDRRRRE